MKPSSLIDIKSRKLAPAQKDGGKINLSGLKVVRIPLVKILKTGLIFFAVFAFIFGLAQAPVSKSSLAQSNPSAEQEQLQALLQELEKEIDQHEKIIETYKKQGSTLTNEIKSLEAKINKLNLQIKAVNLNLQKLSQEISKTTVEISSTQDKIIFNKDALAKSLRLLYESGNEGLMEIILKNSNFSDFYGEVNNLLSIKDSLKDTVVKISELHQELIDQKEQLALEKSDVENLKIYQESQKTNVKKTQEEKADILKVTKGQEAKYQQILQETKKTAAEIRSRIFKLFGGGEMTFGEAYQIAKMAEGATGVRAAFLLAILQGESALGKNVGRCTYNQIMSSGKTAMNPKQIPFFLKIIEELKAAKIPVPEPIKISCPNADGVYGGAMGPAQFMPQTWDGYNERVSQITGHNPANPWNNADAFVASALYLKDAGADQQTIAAEKKAAAKYYCGGNWTRYVCTGVYGQNAVNRASDFANDIATLNS